MIERLCCGLRARDVPGAVEALRDARESVPVRLQDASRAGLWVHGDGAVADVARRWSAALGVPVRLYRVRCLSEGAGVRVQASGATLHPDGTETAIASASEDDWDPHPGDLAERAESWLRIALEVHEGLDDWDSSVVVLA